MWANKRAGPPVVGPQKRLIIKGLRAIPALPANYKVDTLARLRSAIQAIQLSQPTPQGLEELYRDCEGLCLHKFGNDVYAMVQAELGAYTRQRLGEINRLSDASVSESVLELTTQFWMGYTQQLDMIKCIFLYLDRTYVLQSANVASLWSMGLGVVRQCLVDTDMKSRLIRLILGEVAKERDGKSADQKSLLSLVHMFVDLGLYSQFFMPSLIDATRDYYVKESRRLVGSLVAIQPTEGPPPANSASAMSVPQYLAHVKLRLDEETQRAARYLSSSSKAPLLSTVLAELVEKHTERLLTTSFDAMVDAHMLADLANLYSLLSSVNQLDALKRYWAVYVKKVGLRLVQAPELDVGLVSDMLAMKQRLDDVMKSAFQSNSMLAHALRESFEDFINSRRSKPAQLTAKFIDQSIRSGNKSTADEDIDSLLDRVVVLFRFIHDKDLFEAYYKRDLAKRLLYNKSVSADTERSMVQKLRMECGPGFTKRLEGMLRDMDFTSDLDGKFTNLQEAQEANNIGFHASILTQAFWPTYEPMLLTISRNVELAQEQFVQFYSEKHNGRRLYWQPNLGTCLLKVSFDEGPKELSLTIVQGTVLLLFSESDELSYKQIQENTGLEDVELMRTLQSLACGKHRVLVKEPKGRDVAGTDVFTFNASFTSTQSRIKIGQILLKEAEKESKEVEEHIQLDRMYQVDAAIVRILKARKRADHTALMAELLSRLKFNSTSAEVKERIETLIERDYIKRDDADPSLYHYLA
ncbi:Cullin-4A [Coemansia aciculifera]|nr:Cullin-4A [Coemansia aciculifera]